VDDDAKLSPFAESEPGASGLELLLSLTLKWAMENKLALPKALTSITSTPASVLGIASGSLNVGEQADVCIFDADSVWKVETKALISQGKNTPFMGLELPGKVRWTLLNGQVVYQQS
jgi:dihydroorotase